jgi:hypothetical protein
MVGDTTTSIGSIADDPCSARVSPFDDGKAASVDSKE